MGRKEGGRERKGRRGVGELFSVLFYKLLNNIGNYFFFIKMGCSGDKIEINCIHMFIIIIIIIK